MNYWRYFRLETWVKPVFLANFHELLSVYLEFLVKQVTFASHTNVFNFSWSCFFSQTLLGLVCISVYYCLHDTIFSSNVRPNKGKGTRNSYMTLIIIDLNFQNSLSIKIKKIQLQSHHDNPLKRSTRETNLLPLFLRPIWLSNSLLASSTCNIYTSGYK